MKKVSMKDIAELFGVSTVTVSKALGDKDGVSETLRAEIKKKAAELGYLQNAPVKSKGLGVLVPERFFGTNAFYSRLYSEVSIAAANRGSFTVLEAVSAEDEQLLQLPKLASMTDGIIFLGQFSDRYIEFTAGENKPCVFLDFYSDILKAPAIISDNCFDSYRMTRYLIERGHRKIAFLGSISETTSIRDRYLGYHRAMMEFSLPQSPQMIIPDRNSGTVFSSFSLPDELPDAFVCNCDTSAVLLTEQLKSMGVKVPEDVSVVGFDDSVCASVSKPSLTTCRVDTRSMSERAVDTLLHLSESDLPAFTRFTVQGEIIERGSVLEKR